MPLRPAELSCWKCGASLAELSLPLRRLEECKACGAELHVCRLCEFHDPAVAKSCREPVAEEVKDKTRANFCDYFRPRPGAYVARTDEAARARGELESLFGGGESPGAKDAKPSAEDEARIQLESLFGPRSG
ncbi:MAG: hypothetical protein MUC71_05845 [Steroidobacteraceae bacterium]|jgi:hypothetical protein|nr:hypothetical protein [Steroidobacteraceae bacterium]